jgi:methylenetetrahydrofolate reductase (NADPH)
VRGDPPREQPDFRPHPDSLPHASDLIGFVRPRWDFCVGAAGYPEGHVEATDKGKDLEYLKLKVDRGAEFVIANYAYDNRFYLSFVERARALGVRVPILPGVMPIFSVKMMESLSKLCGASIPDEVRRGIAALPPGDAEALVAWGIDYAARQCRGLLEAGAPGIHIYTMDRSASAAGIVRRLREAGVELGGGV